MADNPRPLRRDALPFPELVRPLTKSRFQLGRTCPTKLAYTGKPEYANAVEENPFFEMLRQGGFQVGALAKFQYPGGKEIVPGSYLSEMEQTSLLLTQKDVTIYEAAFGFGNFYVKADVVIRQGTTLRLLEVKAKGWNAEKDSFWQKNGTGIKSEWEKYLTDIAFQAWVVTQARPDLTVEPFLVFADKTATASVDGINQCFVLEEDERGRSRVRVCPSDLRAEALGENLLVAVPVKEVVEFLWARKERGEAFPELAATLAQAYREDRKIPAEISLRCRDCEFRADVAGKRSGYVECWKEATGVEATDDERPRVYDLWRSPKATELLGRKTYFVDQLQSIADIAPNAARKDYPGFTPAERQWMQAETIKKGTKEPRLHRKLRETLLQWRRPLHFIDFETTAVALPFHKGRRPYELVAFQFSHHRVDADETIHHSEWLCLERGKFPNFDFVRALKRELVNDDGTVLRYSPHENTVLCTIYRQLRDSSEPDRDALCAWIESVAAPSGDLEGEWEDPERMADMFEIHKNFFFHPSMGGSNSIKALLPAVMEWSRFLKKEYPQWVGKDPYAELAPVLSGCDWEKAEAQFYGEGDELREGGAAMMAYLRSQFGAMTDVERAAVGDALKRYCKLDTLAMVMIWQGWVNG